MIEEARKPRKMQCRLNFGEKFKLVEVLNGQESYPTFEDAAKYATGKMGRLINATLVKAVSEQITAEIKSQHNDAKGQKIIDRIKDLEARVTNIELQACIAPPEL